MADNIKVISSSVTVDVDAPTNKRKSTGTAVSGEAKFIEEGKEKLLYTADGSYADANIGTQCIQVQNGYDDFPSSGFERSSVDDAGRVDVLVEDEKGVAQSKEVEETPLSREVGIHVRDAIRRATSDKQYTPEEIAGLEKLNKAIVDAVLKENFASEAKHIMSLADDIAPNAPNTKLSTAQKSL